MSVSFYPVITTALGVELARPMDFFSLEYTRVENDIGTATLTLPRARYTESLFAPDNQIIFNRAIDNGTPYEDAETVWLIRDWERSTAGKEKTWTIRANCLNHFWKRRIVDYNEYNAYTSKLDELDDMGKAVWRENYGALVTDATRDYSAYISTQQNLAQAPIALMSFAREKVYDVLRNFAATSWEYGTYLVFDTVLAKRTQPRFEFRSYVGQRGVDRRSIGSLVFSTENENLANAKVVYESSDEVTRGIAGGQGVATTQAVARYTSPRASVSPFNLIEEWGNFSNEQDGATGLQAAARGIVNKRQPRKTLTGDIVSKPGALYGKDWRWGDRVIGADENDRFDCRISAVSVRFDRDGGEQVKAQLRGELTNG